MCFWRQKATVAVPEQECQFWQDAKTFPFGRGPKNPPESLFSGKLSKN